MCLVPSSKVRERELAKFKIQKPMKIDEQDVHTYVHCCCFINTGY